MGVLSQPPSGAKEIGKMRNTMKLKAIGVLLVSIAVAACVEHRPIRNGLLDESTYLNKHGRESQFRGSRHGIVPGTLQIL